MNLDQAANFFTGSILIMLGLIVITMGIVAINYLLHTYWKPVQFLKFQDYPPLRYMTHEEEAAANQKQKG